MGVMMAVSGDFSSPSFTGASATDLAWNTELATANRPALTEMPAVQYPLSSRQQTDFLSQLNDLREQLTNGQVAGQPAATNMVDMTWDDDLATLTQTYSAHCDWEHNGARTFQYAATGHTSKVGEDLAVGTGSYTYASALTNWWAENKDYTYDTGACAPGKVCGHYTALAWATTTKVGCGVSTCPTMKGLPSTFTNAVYVVCDFSPAGNFRGQKPYASSGSPAPPTPEPTPAPVATSSSGGCANAAPEQYCSQWHAAYGEKYGCDRVTVSYSDSSGSHSGTLATECASTCGACGTEMTPQPPATTMMAVDMNGPVSAVPAF